MNEPAPSRLSEQIQLHSIRDRLLSGGIWAFAGKATAAAGGVVISALLTRLLSPQEIGAYFLALSVVAVTAMLARAGLDKTVLQLIAASLGRGDESAARAVVRRVFTLAAVSAFLVAAALWFGGADWLARSLFSSASMTTIAWSLTPWVVVLCFELLFAETFRGFHDIPKASVFGGPLTRVLTATTLLTLLISAKQIALTTAVSITIAAHTVSILLAWWFLRGKLAGLHAERRPDGGANIGSILHVTWPFLISNFTFFVRGQSDLWILGVFRPEQEVAIYAVTMRLVLLVGISLTVVNAVLPPVLGELHSKGRKDRLERVVRVTASVAALPSVIALLAFILAGGSILAVVFGSFYREGAVILAVLSIGQLIGVWTGSCGYALIMTGHQRDLMWSAVVSGSITVVGGLAVVQTAGALGVAVAVATGTVVQQTLMLYLAKRRVGIWTHASPSLAIEGIHELVRTARSYGRRSG